MSSHIRKSAWVAGFLVVSLVGVVYALHSRPRWAVERYKRQLLAAGEKLQVEELLPPPVFSESNGAPIFRQVMGGWGPSTNLLEKNQPPAMRMVAPGKAMVGWAQPDIRGTDQTNTWSEMTAAIEQYRGALDVIRDAASCPAFDFQLDYRQGPSLLLPHLAPLKRSVQRLTTATLCDLHAGNAASATTNVQIMLALVKATADERLAISQLVRLAMANISLAATWELLQAPNLTDDQLTAIQRSWSKLDFIQPAQNSLAMERALDQMTLERMRNSSAQFRQIISGFGPGSSGGGGSSLSSGQLGDEILHLVVLRTREARWRFSQSYPDQLRALKGFQVLLESFRLVEAGEPFKKSFDTEQQRLAELGLQSTSDEFRFIFDPSGPDLGSMFSGSVISLSRVLNRVFVTEAGRRLAITALALKRYQLAHGRFPNDLSDLIPKFLLAVPGDPADDQPVRYRLKPDGSFLLYSVGEDGIDNGGDPSPAVQSKSPNWQQGRDLVWPWPASPEEMSIFHQKHPK